MVENGAGEVGSDFSSFNPGFDLGGFVMGEVAVAPEGITEES